MIGIGAGETQSACQAWIDTHGLTYYVLSDPGGAVYGLFGNGYVPYNAIIDGDGILQYTTSGFNATAVVGTVEQLLAELLWIDHTPLKDTEDNVNPYQTLSTITSGYALVSDDLRLHWNLDGGSTFTDVILTPAGGDDYTANIPAQPYGTTVYYYISAADTGGRTRTNPADAPIELHSFYVGVDSTLPVIDHEPLGDQVPARWPATVSATVTDNVGVDTVTLEFRINGGPPETVPMVFERDGVYSADFFGSVSVGDMIEYRIIAVDVASTPNTAIDPASGYFEFSIVEPMPVFIYEPDGAPLSGTAIAQELDGMGISYDMGTTLTDSPSLYRTIFVCLGVYATNHQLTQAEGEALATFLDYGGRLYMEGADTWYYDPETAVHPYFNIDGLSDGVGDAGPIAGAAGTFSNGMQFEYSGSNAYIDHIAPIGDAEAVFLNVTPQYINGVAYDSGTYRTIGTSFQLGGLVDGTAPSTKHDLLAKILEFFEIDHLIVLFEDGFETSDTSAWSATSP